MKLNHIFSGRPVRVALVAATALLCMAAGWRRVPVSPIPETPARIATARTVAIGGSEVANGGIGSLNTDSTVATLGSASYLQVDQYRQTQLESFAVQGWQAKPYVITYTSSDESICTVDGGATVFIQLVQQKADIKIHVIAHEHVVTDKIQEFGQ